MKASRSDAIRHFRLPAPFGGRSLLRGLPLLAVVLIILCAATDPGRAELAFVSGKPAAGDPERLTSVSAAGDPRDAAVSLAHGFPLWYEDATGLRLQLCLDPAAEVAPGIVVDPCEFAPAFRGIPVSFPGNFATEAIYWTAIAAGTYASSNGAVSSALLVLAHEAGFADEGPVSDGTQVVFSRIRIRIDVPVAGTYRVTHPFGRFDYPVAVPGLRAINQTQDFGVASAQDFLASMRGVPPTVPAPFDPSRNAGVVSETGATIGPFLRPALAHGGVFNAADPTSFRGGPIATPGGAVYIALPFAPNAAVPTLPFPVFQPVTGSPFLPDGPGGDPANYFRIELLDPPPGFFLNAAAGTQVVEWSEFQIVGKIFADQPNRRPTADDITLGTAAGRSRSVDVLPDTAAMERLDPAGAGNAYGIEPQAIAPANASGPVLNAAGMPVLTGTLPTAAGGSVRRTTVTATGKTSFLYAPPPSVGGVAYTGPDSFRYVLQDRGGLISPPALVSFTVERLGIDRAELRIARGIWRVEGTSSDREANRITLYGSPRARLTWAQARPPVAANAVGHLALAVGEEGIDFVFRIDPLPDSPVTEVRIRLGGSEAEGGETLFFPYFALFDGPFSGVIRGRLTGTDLIPRPDAGVSTLADAAAAIRAGRTHATVHTAAHPAGALRGQILRPVAGETEVTAEGRFSFRGKVPPGPSLLPAVGIRSANGVESGDLRLRLK